MQFDTQHVCVQLVFNSANAIILVLIKMLNNIISDRDEQSGNERTAFSLFDVVDGLVELEAYHLSTLPQFYQQYYNMRLNSVHIGVIPYKV